MSVSTARPVALVPTLFGTTPAWLYGSRGKRGVVIVGSIGFEALCSHRFLRILADRLAARGLPVLRYDAAGTGDAMGQLDADSPVRWTQELHASIDHVKAMSGAEEIVVIGLRLGALIAQTIGARADVTMLALLAPPASGNGFVRELTAISRLIDGTLPPPPEPVLRAEGDVQSAGFLYPAAFINAVRALEWQRPQRQDLKVLVTADAKATAAPIATLAQQAGLALTTLPFTGYGRMMCDPTAGIVALEAMDALIGWIGEGAPTNEPIIAPSTVLEGDGWREQRVLFDAGRRLAGVWCIPEDGKPERAVIFTNSGAIPHSGWAGMSTDNARRLARAGIASLRMDFAEIGDSCEATSGSRLFLYDVSARDDLVSAMDFVVAQGIGTIVLSGLCAGAHQAFHTAVADRRVKGLVLVNPLCFIWGPRYAIGLTAWRHARTFESDVTGGSDGGPVATMTRLIRRSGKKVLTALTSGKLQQSARRLLRLPPKNEVLAMMKALTARGCHIMLVSSEGDDSIAEIERYLGPDAALVADDSRIDWRFIPASDHTLTPPHARALLARWTEDAVPT